MQVGKWACLIPMASMQMEVLGCDQKVAIPIQQGAARCNVSVPCCCAQDLPVGHTLCLSGKTFVVSGQLDSLTRQQARASPPPRAG